MQSGISTHAAYRIYLLTFSFMVLASALGRTFPGNFDELAHASYILHLAETRSLALESIGIPIYDPSGWTLTGEFNYTPHPSGYYLFLATIAQALMPFDQSSVMVLRLINAGLAAGAVAAALRIGLLVGWGRPAYHAFALVIILIPNLAPIGGALSNDNFAILGGCLAALGAYRALSASDNRTAAISLMMLGFALAALAKATAALQVGIMLVPVFAIAIGRDGMGLLRRPMVVVSALIGLAAMIPYLAMTIEYGSPVPIAPGYAESIATASAARGWNTVELDLLSYAAHFGNLLAANWPIHAEFGHAILAPGIVLILVGGTGVARAGYDVLRGERSAITLLILCGAASLAVTVALHFATTYELYRSFDDLGSVHPRYYFPLLFVISAACSHIIDTLRRGWAQGIAATIVALLALAPSLLALTLPFG